MHKQANTTQPSKSEILPFVTSMDLKGMMLHEIRQMKKDTGGFTPVWNINNNNDNSQRQTTHQWLPAGKIRGARAKWVQGVSGTVAHGEGTLWW